MRPIFRFLLPAGIVICASLRLSAQTGIISIQECLDRARRNYPFLKAKDAQLSSETQRLRSAKTEYLPSLLAGGQINYGTSNSVNGAFFPNEGMSIGVSGGIRPENNSTAVYGSFGTLEVDWRIFNFGKIAANVSASESAVAAAKADYDNEVFQHMVKTADAYLLTLVAEKISFAQENNLDRALKIQSIIRAESLSGLKAGADSSFAAAEVSKARILYLESKKNERTQLIRLLELMGEAGTTVDVDTSKFFNSLPSNFISDTSGIRNLPSLRFYDAQANYRSARAVAIRRSYAPSILLSGMAWGRGSGVSNADGSFNTGFSNGVGFQATNFLTAISFRMNILNYSKVHADYKAETFEAERARYVYKEAALRAGKQLEIADLQLDLAREQAKEAPVQLHAAITAYRQSQARYQTGLASLAELAQTFYILNRAEVDKSIAMNNVWRALLLKAAATGDLSTLINQIN